MIIGTVPIRLSGSSQTAAGSGAEAIGDMSAYQLGNGSIPLPLLVYFFTYLSILGVVTSIF
jgi:hypothetical protein